MLFLLAYNSFSCTEESISNNQKNNETLNIVKKDLDPPIQPEALVYISH